MQQPRYAADVEALVALCRERGVAVQTIKSIVRRPWAGQARTHNTYFYEPLETQEPIDKAVHWALGLPDSFCVTAGDMQLLPKVLDAASRFETRPSGAEMALLSRKFDLQPIFA